MRIDFVKVEAIVEILAQIPHFNKKKLLRSPCYAICLGNIKNAQSLKKRSIIQKSINMHRI